MTAVNSRRRSEMARMLGAEGFQSIIRLIQCSLQKAVRSWPNKHNLITLQIKVSYLSPDFK